MSKIEVFNTAAELDKKVKQAPGEMFHFEAVKNAKEAYDNSKKPFPEKLIDIKPINPALFFDIEYDLNEMEITDALCENKLSIFNYGDGMSAKKLRTVLNAASSGDEKVQYITNNHGEGATLTSMVHNPLGMLMISCCDGIASLAWLHMVKDGIYNVPERYDFYPSQFDATLAGSDFQDILNITNTANWDELNAKYDNQFTLDHDWTCVIALGTEPGQDTCQRPHHPDKNPEVQHWLARDLQYRLFRKPADLMIRIAKGMGVEGDYSREFLTYEEGIQKFITSDKYKDTGVLFEWITEPVTNIRIGYLFEPSDLKTGKNIMKQRGPQQTTYSAIIYEDMAYSRYASSWTEFTDKWSQIAPSCGITVPKHQQRFRIVVELPSDANIIPTDWRQHITFSTGDKQPIRFNSMLPNGQRICDIVKANMPQWMKDKLRELDTPTTVGDKLQTELANKLKELLANRKANIGGNSYGNRANVGRRAKHVATFPPSMPTTRNKSATPTGGAGTQPRTPSIPTLRFCNDVAEWNEMGGNYTNVIHNKAAWYDIDNQQVWLNGKYPVLDTQIAEVMQKVPCEHEDYHGQIETLVNEAAAARVGEFIIHCIAKTVERNGWDYDTLEQSYTPMALTPGAVDIFYNREDVFDLAKKVRNRLENKIH
jgi:hypothetical protein